MSSSAFGFENDSVSSLSNASLPVEEQQCPFGGKDVYTPVLAGDTPSYLHGFPKFIEAPFQVSLQLLVATVALVGNVAVAYLIFSVRSLHTANNLFVCALAVADTLVALNIPFYVSFYFDVPYKCDRTFCAVR